MSEYPRDEAELEALGLASVGQGVSIHPSVEIFGAENVSIGSNVRIDCFAVITAGPGEVTIGDGAHLGVGACLLGTAGIRIGDFVSLSPRATILSTSDDFTEGHMAGPNVPAEFRSVDAAEVVIERHAIVGSGAVVLPGAAIGWGAAVGALSLVKGAVEAGSVVAGTPARRVGTRNLERLQELERRLEEE
jgi:acetyltransferase-like isoleucine patch superfamily enzyme